MNESHSIKLQAEISATSKGLVEALQKASGAVNDASQNWKGKFNTLKESTSVVGQSIKNLTELIGQVGNVDLGVEGMDKIKSSIADVSNTFAQVKGEVDSFVTTLSELKLAASEIGMPIEEYQRFSDAVKATGMSMGDATAMVKTMQSNISDFANGIPEAQQMFAKLGISLEQLSSNTITGNLSEIAKAINDTIPASERATANMQLFKSSIDNTLAVVDQYNKATSRQSGEYASDKDVQNAIGLSNAIGALGEKLTTFITSTNDAASAGAKLSRSLDDMFELVQQDKEELGALAIEYNNYVESLKGTATSTLDASKALEVFSEKIKELRAQSIALKDISGEGLGLVTDDDVQKANEKFSRLQDFLKSAEEQIKNEMDAVDTIMRQRLDTGAPIDTKEMETAVEHIRMLKQALADLNETRVELGIPEQAVENFNDLSEYIEKAEKQFTLFADVAEEKNLALSFENAKKAIEEIEEKIRTLHSELAKTGGLKIDASELEKLKGELADIEEKQFELKIGSDDAQRAIDKVKELKKQIEDVQRQASRGTPVWQPLVIATRAIKNGWEGIKRSVRDAGGIFGSLKGALRSCVDHITHFKSTTQATANAGQSLSSVFKQAGAQVMHMGSHVAVVALAIRNLTALAKKYFEQQAEEDAMAAYGYAAQNADDLKRVQDKNNNEMEALVAKLKEFADLYDEERTTGSETAFAKRRNLQEELKKQYGFNFEETDGELKKLDEQIANKLEEIRQRRIRNLGASIRSNQRIREGVREYADKIGDDGLRLFSKGYWYRVFHPTFASKMREGTERATQANYDIMSAKEERARLERESPAEQYLRLRNAKTADETTKKEEEAQKAAEKAKEEQAKALEEANKKLQEWSNSLNDTEHQKNLRAIMEKYDEAVKAGINEEEAKKVALQAINAMLQKEREDEDKKNKELLDALNQHIEQYKNAYRNYLNAQKDINEAQREYAQTQRDLARENKADRIQKRRERLQSRMRQFGFTPSEGFRLNETASQRNRRRNRVRLDASISEKMSRWQAGERVNWTMAERRRIRQYQRLESKDKQLEAVQRQMDAAEKQRQAADALKEAAKAINNAIAGRNEAIGNLRGNASELRGALGNRPVMSSNGRADQVLWNALRYGLNARGVSGAWSQTQGNYNQQLSQLHADLEKMQRNVYLVR